LGSKKENASNSEWRGEERGLPGGTIFFRFRWEIKPKRGGRWNGGKQDVDIGGGAELAKETGGTISLKRGGNSEWGRRMREEDLHPKNYFFLGRRGGFFSKKMLLAKNDGGSGRGYGGSEGGGGGELRSSRGKREET